MVPTFFRQNCNFFRSLTPTKSIGLDTEKTSVTKISKKFVLKTSRHLTINDILNGLLQKKKRKLYDQVSTIHIKLVKKTVFFGFFNSSDWSFYYKYNKKTTVFHWLLRIWQSILLFLASSSVIFGKYVTSRNSVHPKGKWHQLMVC